MIYIGGNMEKCDPLYLLIRLSKLMVVETASDANLQYIDWIGLLYHFVCLIHIVSHEINIQFPLAPTAVKYRSAATGFRDSRM